MSVQSKLNIETEKKHYLHDVSNHKKRVNVRDLIVRLKTEKKEEKKQTVIVSVIAVSAVTIFGIILTI
jgi:hypothetical protein